MVRLGTDSKIVFDGDVYQYIYTTGDGCGEVFSKKKGGLSFLQGDEASDLYDQLDGIEANERFSVEEIIDLVLSDYDY